MAYMPSVTTPAKTDQFMGTMQKASQIQSSSSVQGEYADPVYPVQVTDHALNNQPIRSGTIDVHYQPTQMKPMPDWKGMNKTGDTLPPAPSRS